MDQKNRDPDSDNEGAKNPSTMIDLNKRGEGTPPSRKSTANAQYAGQLLFILVNSLLFGTASAQQLAVSATAAWSSQIVAFWGALVVGVRSSAKLEVTNAVTSVASSLFAFYRSRQIFTLLQHGDWLLHSGWENGKTRMDVVLICWRTPRDLAKLALHVAMQIEVVGDSWEVLVCGRQLKGPNGECRAHWIQSPRCADFCAARVAETGENYFPITMESINEAILQVTASSIDDIALILRENREKRSSRCAYISEVRREMQDEQTLARHFTTYTQNEGETPFVQIAGQTLGFGSSRRIMLKCSSRMYALLHLTVAIAISLMGAASGRGLAIWVMALRPALHSLGTSALSGNNAILSLLSFDSTVMEYETGDGSDVLAGDTLVYGLTWRSLLGSIALPGIEFGLLIGGWLYGALNVEKLHPHGIVGHGMLWLAVFVSLSLSIRALLGVRQRVSGRLMGIFVVHEYVRFVIGNTVPITVEPISTPSTTPPQVRLIVTLLRDCQDDDTSIIAASGVLRHPTTCTLLARYVVTDILGYQYTGDTIVRKGDSTEPVTTASAYSQTQSIFCIVITMCCALASAVYAYFPLPKWVKPMLESLLLISAVWFATLERTPQLNHNRDSYICHMVATMVVSAVWYVGVKDVG